MTEKAGAKQTILRAAERCIARNGVRGLRVHDVAKEAGVSTSLLYYHFTDRDGLLAATLDHVNDNASVHRIEGTSGDTAVDRLASLLVGEIQDVDEVRTGSVAWNELRATAVFEEGLRAPLARTTETWNDRITAALDETGADGDHAALAQVLTALVEGLSGRWLGGELTTREAQDLLRTAIDHLIRPGGPIRTGRTA